MITVLGSINIDQVGMVDRFPEPGETVAGKQYMTTIGGKGANQALAVARAGGTVQMVGAVGSDLLASLAVDTLKAEQVGTTGVRHVTGATGIANILVDASGENMIAVFANANGEVDQDYADLALEAAGEGDFLLLQQEIPVKVNNRALSLARQRGVVSILNIAPFLPNSEESTSLADIVVANGSEFMQLTGCELEDIDEGMKRWAATTGKTIIVTLGKDGANAASSEGFVHVSAPKIRAINTVGAGDAFCGSLAVSLSQNCQLGDALENAVQAASRVCMA